MSAPTLMVLIVNPSATEPVYHRFGTPTPEQWAHHQHVAACGQTCSPWGQCRVRLNHAMRFGRACRRCFS